MRRYALSMDDWLLRALKRVDIEQRYVGIQMAMEIDYELHVAGLFL